MSNTAEENPENTLLNLGKKIGDLTEDQKEVLRYMEKKSNERYAAQRLTTVKEKLDELEISESDTKSYSNAFMKGRKAERKRILTLIEEELQ